MMLRGAILIAGSMGYLTSKIFREEKRVLYVFLLVLHTWYKAQTRRDIIKSFAG